MMKLHSKIRDICCALAFCAAGVILALACVTRSSFAFADAENVSSEEHFVTIYDDGRKLTVKTSALSVGEVLERAEILLNETDIVEPSLETQIYDNSYEINIYRARPAIVIDGANTRFLMTASFDPKQIARDAGFTVYDGDEINLIMNRNFLEAGAVSTYEVTRNGGRTLTIEESLPYTIETRYDYNLAKGERQLVQAGQNGLKVSVYDVQFERNVEISRTLVSETVVTEPVVEIVTVGAKLSIAPEQETCAGWLREAGVAEESLEAALYIIYHESGCRVDAENVTSGAYGIPQALPGYKMADESRGGGPDWQTNPITQIRWMDYYVKNRYGGWQGALDFKYQNGWY